MRNLNKIIGNPTLLEEVKHALLSNASQYSCCFFIPFPLFVLVSRRRGSGLAITSIFSSSVPPITEHVSVCVCKHTYLFVHQKNKLKNLLWLQGYCEATFSMFSFIGFGLWGKSYK